MGEAIRPGQSRLREPMPLTSKKRARWILPLVGVACVLLYLLVLTVRGEPTPGTVLTEPPAEALGHWVTTDERYADRGLTVGARDIVLEVGPDDPPMRGEIRVVSVWEEGEATVVYIEYDVGEGPAILEMLLEGSNRMRLRNPPEVTWTRTR